MCVHFSQAVKIEYCSWIIKADLCKILHTTREELAQTLEEASLCFQSLKQVCTGLLDTGELTLAEEGFVLVFALGVPLATVHTALSFYF